MILKNCRVCRLDKDPAYFSTLNGRHLNVCLSCESKRVSAYQVQRAALDENYKEERRRQIKESKDRYPTKTVQQYSVRQKALTRLANLHREDYERLVDEVREEVGLPPSNRLRAVEKLQQLHQP